MMQETHSTAGITAALRIPPDFHAEWSHLSRHTGGVGIMLNRSFLKQFHPVQTEDWEEPIPGRFAILHLRGPLGQLSLAVVCFTSGHHSAEAADERARMRAQLRARIEAAPDTTWIVAGDYNWASHAHGRLELGEGRYTGGHDEPDEAHWKTHVQQPLALHELQQPTHTYRSSTATSRLDRVYVNHHPSAWLLGNFGCAALPWTPSSDHRPVYFCFLLTATKPQAAAIRDRHIDTPGFSVRVALAFEQRVRAHMMEHGEVDCLSKLAILKDAMYEVAAHIDDTPITTQDRPGLMEVTSSTALKILSSIHRGTIATLTQLRHRLPHAWRTEITPVGGTLAQAELKLRDKAVALTKEEFVRYMKNLHEDKRILRRRR
jgi:hypothetical protein